MTRFEELCARWPSDEDPPVHPGEYEEKCQNYTDMLMMVAKRKRDKKFGFVKARQTAEAMYELVAEGYFEETRPFVFARTSKSPDKRAQH
jgi:hypothetical protein